MEPASAWAVQGTRAEYSAIYLNGACVCASSQRYPGQIIQQYSWMDPASERAVNGTQGRIFSNIPEWSLRKQSKVPGAEYSAIYLNGACVCASSQRYPGQNIQQYTWMEPASLRAVIFSRGRIFSNIPELSLRLYEQSKVPGAEYSAIYLNWACICASSQRHPGQNIQQYTWIEPASVRAFNGTRGRIFSNIPELSLRLYEQSTVPGAEYSALYLNWACVCTSSQRYPGKNIPHKQPAGAPLLLGWTRGWI